MKKLGLVIACVAGLIGFAIGAGGAAFAASASANDTARFLAGLPPSAGSPLVPLTLDKAWQHYAAAMDKAFAENDSRQLSRIRVWSAAHLTAPRETLYYMFSGPDFLYANAFFPRATTYVLAGLEPPGAVPDLLALRRGAVPAALASVRNAMRTLLSASFFVTAEMNNDLHASPLRGTLPVLYVFLARSGKTIRDVSLVNLDARGEPIADTGPKAKAASRGARIVFARADGLEQTLYYFSTDLTNSGIKRSGFLTFAGRFGDGDSFVKSASYLMHGGEFSQVRDFLLRNSATLLQDDTGVPLRLLDAAKWELSPFGRYLTPIPVFEGVYQAKMHDLFRRNAAKAIDFGVGYRWRPGESNLLLATRRRLDTASRN
ncbi:MAG: hypothetical protein Q8M26_11550 [Pseudolabrys sp.]|nr:hypothetical protein [Pseudolabrys sp.]